MTKSLSDEQIQQRIPVWCALAQLFLDTELHPADFARIASVIAKAGFSITETEQILEEEVAPAFTPNLAGATGEWAGWSDEFIKERVLAPLNAGAAKRAIAKIRARRHRNLYMGAWQEVARLLLKSNTPDQPPRRR